MPRRNPFATGEIVHVLNRGVAKGLTFATERDYSVALEGLQYYRFAEPPIKFSRVRELTVRNRTQLYRELSLAGEPLVDMLAFTLMPNHFHLLLRQRIDGGVTTYLRRWTDSYTRYFNTRHERVGPLFQGVFKAVPIRSDDQLLHVSRYAHLNAVVGGLCTIDALASYPWTSYGQYVAGQPGWCETSMILAMVGGAARYQEFVEQHVDHAQELERIKHLTLE